MKHYTFPIIAIFIIAALVGLIAWARSANLDIESSDPHIVTMQGLHAHPQLEIYVRGEKIEIPQNIGIGQMYAGRSGYGQGGMAMTPIHTHDDVPIIHHEFSGVVTYDDLTLKQFFAVWGREFMSFGDAVTMTVNGVLNTELENYSMKDGDKIILRYE